MCHIRSTNLVYSLSILNTMDGVLFSLHRNYDIYMLDISIT